MLNWIVLLFSLSLTYILIHLYKKTYHFSKWGIPQPPEWPLFGTMFALFFPRRHVNDLIKYIYNFNTEAKYIGCHMFLKPAIVVRDLDLIKTVLVKNFDHFADRKTFVDESTDPLFGKNLNFLNGERWREVRNMLSPAFTSSKMRAMYTLMSSCAENFTDVFLKLYGDSEAVDTKDSFGRYTNDLIASCAFGIEIDSLQNPTNEFYVRAKETVTFKGVTMLKILLEIMFPSLTRKLGMRIVSKNVTEFFVGVIDKTIKTRDEQGIIRPDMLQLMMKARDNTRKEKGAKLDLLEMTAQAFIFFLGGYESNSIQLSLIAQELAMNPDVQAKVQEEIDALKEINEQLSYEDVSYNMPYLDAVFSETLRKHSIAFLNRQCSKEFELPPSLPGSRPYKIKPGTDIMIPVSGIHHDSNYYEHPDKFDPDRFVNKKASTADLINLGFGMGPRMCIGNRFAILQTKVLLSHLLAKCSFVVCEKTTVPLVYHKNVFAPTPEGGFWLRIKARERS